MRARFASLSMGLALFSLGCGPQRPVVTNGSAGTDFNNDRRADLIAVSRTNGPAGMNHGLLLFPGSVVGLSNTNPAGLSTYVDGTWAARVGDVNRDGFSDFIVGSDSGSGPYEVRVFLGGATITQQTAPMRSPRMDDGSTGKSQGSAAGDVNGDGAPDALVVRRWRIFSLHFGAASGLSSTPDQWLPLGDSEPITDARGVGDLDGDGFGEVAVTHRVGLIEVVRLHRGSATGLDPAVMFELSGVVGGVSDTVDVNGDGRADLVVGAMEGRPGCLHVWAGRVGALALAETSASECAMRTGTFMPPRVIRAGDINADGADDVLLFEAGASLSCASTTPGAYRMRLFHGSPRGLESREHSVVDGPAATLCVVGVDATGVGDLNADGYADVIVGLPSANSATIGQDGPGRLHVYLGGGDGVGPRLRIVEGRPGTTWGLGRFAR
jgi:hypothetical protein